VKDSEAVVHQEYEDMKQADIAALTNGELEKTVEETMVASCDSLCDLISSYNQEDGKMKIMKRQSRACRANMTNLAG
jgi:hypothetical protein